MRAAPRPLLDRLADETPNLSRNHQALAKYIHEHYQSVAFSTVRQLSQQAGVSVATIIRFAKALGFSGYPGLQQEIRRMVRADLKGTERFALTTTRRGPPDADPLDGLIDKELQNINGLRETLDRKALAGAVKLLHGASAAVIVGARGSAPLAQHLWFGLDKIGIPATRFLSVTSETYEHVDRLDRKACVVVIGFPRYLRDLVDVLAHAQRRKLKTIAITDSPFSALRSDVMLCAPSDSASFVAAHGAALLLVNALLLELSVLDKTRTLHALNRFEALADEKSYFHTTHKA